MNINKTKKRTMILETSWISQRDAVKLNKDGSATIDQPSNHCFTSAATDLLNYLGHRFQIDQLSQMARYEYESILHSACMQKGEDYESTGRYKFENHEEAINVLLKGAGLSIRVRTRIFQDPITEIKRQIDLLFPVLLSANIFKGHILLSNGYDANGLFFDDSYGNFNTHYKDRNGSKVHYSHETCSNIIPAGKPYLEVG